MAVYLFLDVDGVLNAQIPGGPAAGTGFPNVRSNVDNGTAQGFRIRWNRTIIRELNAFLADPAYDVRPMWATTWRHDAGRDIGCLVGLDGSLDWPVLHPDLDQFALAPRHEPSIHWKVDAVQRVMANKPDDHFIHVDDELRTAWGHVPRIGDLPYVDWAQARGDLLIGPNPVFGLTKLDIDTMRVFANNQGGDGDD